MKLFAITSLFLYSSLLCANGIECLNTFRKVSNLPLYNTFGSFNNLLASLNSEKQSTSKNSESFVLSKQISPILRQLRQNNTDVHYLFHAGSSIRYESNGEYYWKNPRWPDSMKEKLYVISLKELGNYVTEVRGNGNKLKITSEEFNSQNARAYVFPYMRYYSLIKFFVDNFLTIKKDFGPDKGVTVEMLFEPTFRFSYSMDSHQLIEKSLTEKMLYLLERSGLDGYIEFIAIKSRLLRTINTVTDNPSKSDFLKIGYTLYSVLKDIEISKMSEAFVSSRSKDEVYNKINRYIQDTFKSLRVDELSKQYLMIDTLNSIFEKLPEDLNQKNISTIKNYLYDAITNLHDLAHKKNLSILRSDEYKKHLILIKR